MIIASRFAVCPELVRYAKWDFDSESAMYRISIVLDGDDILTWLEPKKETVDAVLKQVDAVLKQIDALIEQGEEIRKSSGIIYPGEFPEGE